jgi:hypothetical protein
MSIENKVSSLYRSRILPSFLSLAMLVSPLASSVKSYADEVPTSTGTEQAQIDLNKYAKVAEQDGLEVYVSKISLKPIHDSNKQTNPDWKKSNCVRFYDIILKNNNNFGLSIMQFDINAYGRDGSIKKNTYNVDLIIKAWGTNYIKANDMLIQKDRWVSDSNCQFPVIQDNIYQLTGDDGKRYNLVHKLSLE